MDEHHESLADQAAAWVPPWARKPAHPAEPVEPHVPPAEQPVPPAEPPGEPPIVEHPAPVAPADDVRVPVEPPVHADPVPAEAGVLPAQDVPTQDVPTQDVPAEQAGSARQAASATALALIDDAELRAALESILLVVDEPTSDSMLAKVLEQPTERVTATLAALSAHYTETGRGFDLRRAAGGWRLYTRAEYAPYVERFILDGQQARLTQAALETLAVVAYKQPVTRSRISAIRGVNCDGVIRTLVARGLIEECGSEPDSGAYLYRTTTLFLEKLGLDSVAELPSLAPFLPEDVEEIADAQS